MFVVRAHVGLLRHSEHLPLQVAQGTDGGRWDGGVRIATWNGNFAVARLARLVVAGAGPPLLTWARPAGDEGRRRCLSPADSVAHCFGHAVAHHGQGRWNGVALLSQVGLDDVVRGLPADPGFPDEHTLEARTIAATCGPVRVRSVYVPNGRTPDDPHYGYKLRWLAALAAAVAADASG